MPKDKDNVDLTEEQKYEAKLAALRATEDSDEAER
jgi:hypothetical protein